MTTITPASISNVCLQTIGVRQFGQCVASLLTLIRRGLKFLVPQVQRLCPQFGQATFDTQYTFVNHHIVNAETPTTTVIPETETTAAIRSCISGRVIPRYCTVPK